MPTTPRTAAIDLIQRYFRAFNEGDRPAFFALLAEDVVHHLNQGGTETGMASFRAFMKRMDRCYAEQIGDLVIMADESGTRAAAEFTVRGQYLAQDEGLPPARGQTYQLPAGAFFTLREGRVSRVSMYYNLQDWLRQVAD
jgi:steroid delta-isomerase-like uncharacterized protein